MLKNIESLIKYLKDNRRAQGQRYPFNSMMTMILLGSICGYNGIRPLQRFMKSYESFFQEHLKLPHGVPSIAGLNCFLATLNKKDVIEAFNSWLQKDQKDRAIKWVSADGKNLRSTLTDANGSNQSMLTMVSMYCQASGLVLQVQDSEKKKSDEVTVVKALLDSILSKDANFTMDALHAQKKL